MDRCGGVTKQSCSPDGATTSSCRPPPPIWRHDELDGGAEVLLDLADQIAEHRLQGLETTELEDFLVLTLAYQAQLLLLLFQDFLV